MMEIWILDMPLFIVEACDETKWPLNNINLNVTAFVIIINTKFEASIKVIGETLSVVNTVLLLLLG